jgi:hypothetical protein
MWMLVCLNLDLEPRTGHSRCLVLRQKTVLRANLSARRRFMARGKSSYTMVNVEYDNKSRPIRSVCSCLDESVIQGYSNVEGADTLNYSIARIFIVSTLVNCKPLGAQLC